MSKLIKGLLGLDSPSMNNGPDPKVTAQEEADKAQARQNAQMASYSNKKRKKSLLSAGVNNGDLSTSGKTLLGE